MSDEISPKMAGVQMQKKQIDRMSSIKGRPTKILKASCLQGLQNEELVEFLCVLEAEVQARDLIISAVMKGEIGSALPLSHLLGDSKYAKLVNTQDQPNNEEDDDLWLGEPTAHLNHVVAYHQLVREQMQSMMQSLQNQHKTILRQLECEQQKHAIDTAQGDEVTYMLEKERERLTNEIEFEQGQLLKVEKDRDKLQMTLEKEREEQQNEFHLLVNDCKMFAKQLIDQAQKEDQLVKEIEQEKRKTRALSELMVEEQKKYKEKFKNIDDERSQYQILKQQKQELEIKLTESEKKTKEAHQKYLQEMSRVKLLQEELKQLKSSKYSPGSSENGDELVDGVLTSASSSAANIYQPASIERTKEEPQIVRPDFNQSARMATVRKSNIAMQNKGTVSKSKPDSPVRTAKISSLKTSNEGVTVDDAESASRKVPPPTPPRVSSITARSVPVLPSDIDGGVDLSVNHFVRSNSVGAGVRNRSPIEAVTRYERRQTMGSRSDRIFVEVAVASGFGWQYTKEEGLIQSRRVLDFLGEISIYQNSSWEAITECVNKLFVENFPSRIWQDPNQKNKALSLNSIQSYGLLGMLWTSDVYPVGEKPWELCSKRHESQDIIIAIRLKDETTISCDSLAYSTSIPVDRLKEYCRLIQKYKNVLFLADDPLEAKHFVSCLSDWLKATEDTRQRTSFVASVEENEISNQKNLIKLLLNHGVLVSGNPSKKQHSTVILIDVDYAIANDFFDQIFQWLGKRGINESCYLSNELGFKNSAYFLHDEVIVLAYASRSSLESIDQGVYRVYKVVELPPTMPYLLQRWLRQKAYQYTRTELDYKEIDDWVRWISNVYRRATSDLQRLDIQLELPDIGYFLSAPIDETVQLKSWAEELWTQHFYRVIANSIHTQVFEVSQSEQEHFIQVALKTFFENALLPGCPVRLDI